MSMSFHAETKLFESLLPSLMATSAHKWFVAWDGQAKGVFDTYSQASDFISEVPRETEVLIREITDQEVHLPLYFLTA
jgi:hypothetical protein